MWRKEPRSGRSKRMWLPWDGLSRNRYARRWFMCFWVLVGYVARNAVWGKVSWMCPFLCLSGRESSGGDGCCRAYQQKYNYPGDNYESKTLKRNITKLFSLPVIKERSSCKCKRNKTWHTSRILDMKIIAVLIRAWGPRWASISQFGCMNLEVGRPILRLRSNLQVWVQSGWTVVKLALVELLSNL